MLRAIKKAFPQSTLYYLAAPWVADIVSQISYIDEIILYEAPLVKRSTIAKGWETIKLIRTLRKAGIDTMIIGHRNSLFSILGYAAGILVRIGFAGKQPSSLTHPVPFDPKEYEISRYLDLLSPLGILPDGLQTEIHPVAGEMEKVTQVLSEKGIKGTESVIGIFAGGGENPGTTMPIKRWMPEAYSSLCKKILETERKKILLLGGPGDVPVNEAILSSGSLDRSRIVNGASLFPLRAVPALMKRCDIVIGGDTGPMHVANAVGTKTLFLFGPSDPGLVAPQSVRSRVVWNHPECSPCYTPETVMQKKYFRGSNFICWKQTNECMKAISVDEVYASYVYLSQTESE